MTNRNKQRGDDFERRVAGAFRLYGLEAFRMLRTGAHVDHGDIGGVAGFFVECRNRRKLELAVWLNEALPQAHAVGSYCFVVSPRLGRPIASAYVHSDLATLARLAAERTALLERIEQLENER